jgi:hypothetical protein
MKNTTELPRATLLAQGIGDLSFVSESHGILRWQRFTKTQVYQTVHKDRAQIHFEYLYAQSSFASYVPLWSSKQSQGI